MSSLEIVGPNNRTYITVEPKLAPEQATDYATQLAFILGNIACEHPDYDMKVMESMAKWYSNELERYS